MLSLAINTDTRRSKSRCCCCCFLCSLVLFCFSVFMALSFFAVDDGVFINTAAAFSLSKFDFQLAQAYLCFITRPEIFLYSMFTKLLVGYVNFIVHICNCIFPMILTFFSVYVYLCCALQN